MCNPKFLILLTCLAMFGLSAHAACGGGGYKPRKEEKRVREVQRVEEGTIRRVSASNADLGSFDSRSAKLSLSDSQRNQVAQARSEINQRQDSLRRERDGAQATLDNCRGKCDKERKRLGEAQARLDSYDANAEFNRRLSGILTDSQMSSYNSGG